MVVILMLSLSPRREFFFFLNARIPSPPTDNVLNFLLFAFSLCLGCSGIAQRVRSRALCRYKWHHDHISLYFLLFFSFCRFSCPTNTPLVNTAWSPPREAHRDQIWATFGAHHTSGLVLALLCWYSSQRPCSDDSPLHRWCSRLPGLLPPGALTAASFGGAQGVLTSEKWGSDPVPRTLLHGALKSTTWVCLSGCSLLNICWKLRNDGWPDFYHSS